MPRGKDKTGGAKTPKAPNKASGKASSKAPSKALAKGKGKASKDSDNESENESVVNADTNKYNNNYDATAHNNGDEDDVLSDGGDIEAEWDEEENVDDDGGEDGGDDDAGEGEDVVDMGEGADVGDAGGDDDCAYNVTRKQRGSKKLGAAIDKEDDDDDEGADANADENELNEDLYVKPEDRRSGPNLMLYEKVRLLGDRTAQLAQGAKPMIKGVQGMDPRVVAQLELESRMIPIKIIRPLPNGKKEIWSLSELQLKKKYIVYGFTGGTVDKEGVAKIVGEYKKGGSIVGYSHLTNHISTVMPVEEGEKVTKTKSKSASKSTSKSASKSTSKSASNSDLKTKVIATSSVTKTGSKSKSASKTSKKVESDQEEIIETKTSKSKTKKEPKKESVTKKKSTKAK